MSDALLQTDLPFAVRRGKVRDVYDVSNALLIVATDRISAFDVVMPDGIPDKGKILTALSLFWLDRFRDVDNHLITADVSKYPVALRPFHQQLAARSMLVEKAEVIPIECVARGYLAGSGWKEYRENGTVCGVKLPAGLRQCEKLPEPLFTPATKAQSGHDVNISFDEMREQTGRALAEKMRARTLEIYARAADYAIKRGVIIADTKFEFGLVQGNHLILIDEILTPDSSRFWPADQYQPGRDQPSYDKQFVRNWLETRDWDKLPPGPALPPDVVNGTRLRYLEAYEKLTGQEFSL